MHFGFSFGIITSFGFGQNFGSKLNQKPKLFIYYNHCLTTLRNCIYKFIKNVHPLLFCQIKPFLIMTTSLCMLYKLCLNNCKKFLALQLRNSTEVDFGFGFGMLCLSVSVSVQTQPKFRYLGFSSNYGFGRSLILT
jgi:hypothetical protein